MLERRKVASNEPNTFAVSENVKVVLDNAEGAEKTCRWPGYKLASARKANAVISKVYVVKWRN